MDSKFQMPTEPFERQKRVQTPLIVLVITVFDFLEMSVDLDDHKSAKYLKTVDSNYFYLLYFKVVLF